MTNSDARFEKLAFPGVTAAYQGKVRETYTTDDGFFIMVATDRVSAYDHVLPKTIPMKGVMLNKMTEYFYRAIGNRVPHWFIASPHPRVLIGYACKRIDVEVIVRGYLAGSLWRAYEKGKRELWGYRLPDGMKENQQLPEQMITPTTKAEQGHDEDISVEEILRRRLCTQDQWEKISEHALKLFRIGSGMANQRNLILVDTKYEFGVDKMGTVRLIDEVHTPDSSRYFHKNEYQKRFNAGEKQHQLSKEFVREWLKEKNFTGEDGQTIPEISDETITSFKQRYLELYTAVTGEQFDENFKDTPEAIVEETMVMIRKKRNPLIGVIMGSDSDLKVMRGAADILDQLCIGYELTVVSAHRTPDRLATYAKTAYERGLKVIIAGAGGAAHLPGMAAAYTALPVIGVPVKSSNSIDGWDSVLSILQMPSGVPVATVALNGATNAGILAAQILGSSDENVYKRLGKYKEGLQEKVAAAIKSASLKEYPCDFEQ